MATKSSVLFGCQSLKYTEGFIILKRGVHTSLCSTKPRGMNTLRLNSINNYQLYRPSGSTLRQFLQEVRLGKRPVDKDETTRLTSEAAQNQEPEPGKEKIICKSKIKSQNKKKKSPQVKKEGEKNKKRKIKQVLKRVIERSLAQQSF